MNASTAIGTTATADTPVVGRFAPSPTGVLHVGSLATATASFLDARCRGGRWLVRIEDLDTARTVPGAADEILRTLDALGFWWDGAVVYQSLRLSFYEQALAQLHSRDLTYACSCTRRDLGATDDVGGYPGTCRPGTCRSGPTRTGATSQRFRTDRFPLEPFTDRLLGHCNADGGAAGDPVVRRRDGLFAYQLAVVVDDAEQGVTDVVRGGDLLASTPWQRGLQRALGYPSLRYAHLPLVCEPGGTKLSKSTRLIVAPAASSELLWQVLTLLRQNPPAELTNGPLPALWHWALAHWRLDALRGVTNLPANC